jgi:hypothetical protein
MRALFILWITVFSALAFYANPGFSSEDCLYDEGQSVNYGPNTGPPYVFVHGKHIEKIKCLNKGQEFEVVGMPAGLRPVVIVGICKKRASLLTAWCHAAIKRAESWKDGELLINLTNGVVDAPRFE